ncbi:antibiotic biosynthesis monooxygenase [Porticoccaceae bacterium]|nr:antibiotic biosynthesis monooxygenase [Porticoccaceae bacterium]
MIERTWRGIANIETASQYIEHLKKHTFPKVRKISGNLGAKVLKRDLNNQVEFLVVTTWTSMAAIKAFADRDIESAVVPEEAQAVLAEYDESVRHYELVDI